MNPKIEKLIKTRDREIAKINEFRDACDHTIKVHHETKCRSGEYPSDPDWITDVSECQECGKYFYKVR